jgi:hypothetical protein
MNLVSPSEEKTTSPTEETSETLREDLGVMDNNLTYR